jgi:TPR repeat protein
MKLAKLICIGLLFPVARHPVAAACPNTDPIVTAQPAVPLLASQNRHGSQPTTAALLAVNETETDEDVRVAINRLGIMYARGWGVAKSYNRAFKLFKQLAMEGYTPGMVNLGILYEIAPAGRRNHRRAYAWVRAALALGVPKDEYDATIFKLGLIAGKLRLKKLDSAERLAVAIVANVTPRCDSSQDPYATITAMIDSNSKRLSLH